MKKKQGSGGVASRWPHVAGGSTLFNRKGHLSPGEASAWLSTRRLGESAGLLSQEARRPRDRCACAHISPQGLGLYAARDIEKHTMVIEYIGTIIRNEVANRKEKLYESQVRAAAAPPSPTAARPAGRGLSGRACEAQCPDVLPIRRWRLRGCDCRAVSPLHRQHPHSLLPIPAVPVSADGALGGPRREWSGRPPAPPSPGSRRARDPGRNSACLFQNRGVYMFRMDSDHVIDATLTGGPAR